MSDKMNEAILCQVPLTHSGEFSSDDINSFLDLVQDLMAETLPTAVACSRLLVIAHDGMLVDLRGLVELGGGAWRKDLRRLRELFFSGSSGLNLNIRRHFADLSEIISETLDDHVLHASEFSYDDVKRAVHFHAEDRATHSLWFLLSFRPSEVPPCVTRSASYLDGTCYGVATHVKNALSERGFQSGLGVYGMKVHVGFESSSLSRNKWPRKQEIDGLGLRKATVERLQSSGIKFLEDICYLTREDLLRVPCFRAKSMDLVMASLRANGLTMLKSSEFGAYPRICMVSLPDSETHNGGINPDVVRFFASNGWQIKPLHKSLRLEN